LLDLADPIHFGIEAVFGLAAVEELLAVGVDLEAAGVSTPGRSQSMTIVLESCRGCQREANDRRWVFS